MGLTKATDVAGMHNTMTFRKQIAGDPTTTVDQVALYNKLVSTIPELFFRPSNNQTPIQLTYPTISTGLQSSNPDVYKPTQYSFVAGPFIIYGGILHNPTIGQVVTLTPGTSLLYVDLLMTNVKNRIATLVYDAAATTLNTPANSFTVRYQTGISSTDIDIYYFAIGV